MASESFKEYFGRTRGNNAAANQADDWKISDLWNSSTPLSSNGRRTNNLSGALKGASGLQNRMGLGGRSNRGGRAGASGAGRSHRGGDIPNTRMRGRVAPKNPVAEPEGYEQFSYGSAPSLQNYLNNMGSVEGMFGSEIQGFANQRGDLEKRRQEALREIARAYTGVGQQMTEGRDSSDANYAQAQATQSGNAEAAQTAINDAVNQGQQATGEVTDNLGISDGVDNSQSERDRAFYASRAAEQAQGQGAQLATNKSSAFNFNNVNIGASGQRSAETQGAAQRDYDTRYAELADQEQQFRSQAAAEQRDMAMQQYSADASRYGDERNFAYQEWLRNQSWNREDAQNALQYGLEQQQSAQDGMVTTDADTLRQRLLQEGVSGPKISEWLLRGQKYGGNGKGMNNLMSKFGGSAGANAALQEYFQKQGYFK